MHNKEKIVSFPHIGNYYIPIQLLVKFILSDYKIQPAPPITKRTLELGSKYSPDFVCVPFKYNLGNYIEALEQGATILVQAGGGCRYGFYGEIQEQILRDLGYEFEFVNLVSMANTNVYDIYKTCRKLGSNLPLKRMAYYALLIMKMVDIMDEIEFYIRENIGFEIEKNSFENSQKQFLNELKTVTNFRSLNDIYKKYNRKFREIETNKPRECFKSWNGWRTLYFNGTK